MKNNVDLSTVTTEELEAILKQKKAQEIEAAAQKRAQYEQERDYLITMLGFQANEAWGVLRELKCEAMLRLKEFRSQMLEYGDLKGGEKNKGNFQIENEAFKISFSSQVKKTFDERSQTAEEHLKLFLNGFVKKRDQKLHKFIMGLLERNKKTGELDIDNINRLYSMETDFDDENWRKAIELFKESYNPTETSEYVRIYRKTESGGWDLINLNFSSL
ncbi:MAG: DUF3164 family protein [Chitinophagales bacterium]|nr:DUF3164 family protein [Chitinophagales bacterium]